MSSQQQKIACPVIGLIIVLLTLTAEFLYLRISHHIQQEFDGALLDKAKTMVSLTEINESGLEFEFAAEGVMPEFVTGNNMQYYQVWNSGGDSLIKSPSLRHGNLLRLKMAPGKLGFTDLTLPDGSAGRLVAVKFVPRVDYAENHEFSTPVAITLNLARERESLDASLLILVNTIFGVTFMIILLSAVLIWYLVVWRLDSIQI